MKIVDLSVHRNTRARRRRREASSSLLRNAKSAVAGKDIDGYVLVTWDSAGAAQASWRQGKMPQRALPDFARGVLQSKAAGAELARRRAGAGKSKSRPFGTAKTEDLRDFARKPKRKS